MGRIFLGRPLHWAALVAAGAVLWQAGEARLQVTSFNLYTAVVAAVAAALVALVLATTRRGEQETRDPLPPADD